MGVQIRCKKSSDGIIMGYIGFQRLRLKVAELSGGPFYQHYQELVHYIPMEDDDAWYEQWDAEAQEMLDAKQADIKIVDFLLQSDCEGSIRYGACKNILQVIGDYDDDILYGYAGHPDCARFKDFKHILEECVRLKCDLVWY